MLVNCVRPYEWSLAQKATVFMEYKLIAPIRYCFVDPLFVHLTNCSPTIKHVGLTI